MKHREQRVKCELKDKIVDNNVNCKVKPMRPIPPLSIVQYVKHDPKADVSAGKLGKCYRVGYYSKQDGLDVIWLVDDSGDYCETTTHAYLYKHYKIKKLSDEIDLYGKHKKKIGPIKSPKKE